MGPKIGFDVGPEHWFACKQRPVCFKNRVRLAANDNNALAIAA